MKINMKQLKANYRQDCYNLKHSLNIIKNAKLSLSDREEITASLSAHAQRIVEEFRLDPELNKISEMPTSELEARVRKHEEMIRK